MLSFQYVKKNSVVIILKINLFAWLGKKKSKNKFPRVLVFHSKFHFFKRKNKQAKKQKNKFFGGYNRSW
eukprot:UN11769